MKTESNQRSGTLLLVLTAALCWFGIGCSHLHHCGPESGIPSAHSGGAVTTTVESEMFTITYHTNRVGRMGYPGFIEFYDKSGKTSAQLFGSPVFGNEPSLSLQGANGARIRLFQETGANGPQVYLHGANGFPRAWLRGTGLGSELKLADDRGKVRMRLVTDRAGGRIEFLDETGKVVKTISEK